MVLCGMSNHHLSYLSTFGEALSSVFQAGGSAMSTGRGSLHMAVSNRQPLTPILWKIYPLILTAFSCIFELQGTVPDWRVWVDAYIIICPTIRYSNILVAGSQPGSTQTWHGHTLFRTSFYICSSLSDQKRPNNIKQLWLRCHVGCLEWRPLDPLGPKTCFWTKSPALTLFAICWRSWFTFNKRSISCKASVLAATV